MEKVYVPTDPHEKAMQRALIQYRNPKNYYLVKEALIKAHREDLIGSGPKCLIRAVPPRSGCQRPLPKAPCKRSAGSKSAGNRSGKPPVKSTSTQSRRSDAKSASGRSGKPDNRSSGQRNSFQAGARKNHRG